MFQFERLDQNPILHRLYEILNPKLSKTCEKDSPFRNLSELNWKNLNIIFHEISNRKKNQLNKQNREKI